MFNVVYMAWKPDQEFTRFDQIFHKWNDKMYEAFLRLSKHFYMTICNSFSNFN